MDEEFRLGWIVGIIEGEGWIGLKSYGGPSVQVASTDEDVILRLAAWTGVGTVSGPKGGTNKPVYGWRISKREDAGRFLERILPFLCERRAQRAREVIAVWKALPPKRGTSPTCARGHPMSGANLYQPTPTRRRCRRCAADRAQKHRDRRDLAMADELRRMHNSETGETREVGTDEADGLFEDGWVEAADQVVPVEPATDQAAAGPQP